MQRTRLQLPRVYLALCLTGVSIGKPLAGPGGNDNPPPFGKRSLRFEFAGQTVDLAVLDLQNRHRKK